MAISKLIFNGVVQMDITDTTATADKILSSYGAYGADGVWMSGSASGGASNTVVGTFTTPSTTGEPTTFTIPYSGSWYPIALIVYISGGMYNNSGSGNTDWYNSLQRYAVGAWYMTKSQTTVAPTYTTLGEENHGVAEAVYKNSTTSSTTYNHSGSRTQGCYRSTSTGAASGNSSLNCVTFYNNGTTVSYYVASTSYGLMASTEYAYIAVYSS